MEHTGKCPKCGKTVHVEEFPGNVVFVVDGNAEHDCPECGTTFLYAEVIGITPDVEPAQ